MSKQLKNAAASRAISKHHNIRLHIEYVDLSSLRAPERAVREHSQRQIKQIAQSLKDFSAIIPAVVDRDGGVIVGAAVIEAARKVALTEFFSGDPYPPS